MCAALRAALRPWIGHGHARGKRWRVYHRLPTPLPTGSTLGTHTHRHTQQERFFDFNDLLIFPMLLVSIFHPLDHKKGKKKYSLFFNNLRGGGVGNSSFPGVRKPRISGVAEDCFPKMEMCCMYLEPVLRKSVPEI